MLPSRRITMRALAVTLAALVIPPLTAHAAVGVPSTATLTCEGTGTLTASVASFTEYDLQLAVTGTCVDAANQVTTLDLAMTGVLDPPALPDSRCPTPTGGQFFLAGTPVVGGSAWSHTEFVSATDWPGYTLFTVASGGAETLDNGAGILADRVAGACGPGGDGWTDSVLLQFTSSVAVPI
jgi:hypothetical protein